MRQERLVALLWLPIWMFTREDEQWPKVKMAALPARLCQTSTKYENKVRQIFRATLIVELATISLLIEAGMTTTEAAIQRIEQIQDALSETFRSNEVSQRVARVIHLLRDQDNTLLYNGSKFDAMVSASDHSNRFGRFKIMSGLRAI